MTDVTNVTPEKRASFVAALESGLSIAAACRASLISRQTAYRWRKEDEEFKSDWDSAIEIGTDKLEDVAMERAEKGSDLLTIFLLKARRPDKFKERTAHELTGKDGAPLVPIVNITVGPSGAQSQSAPEAIPGPTEPRD